MKKSLFVYLGMLLSYVSFGQYLTNLNYSINFGDLAEIDVPYKASKSVLDGDYLYHITYSSTTTLGNHILVKKHHVDGTPAWEAVYGDIGPITNNHAVDIKVDASGNVYIVGATKHLTEGYNALVVKFNNIGIKQWDYTYHSSGGDDDIATALDIDGSGNCYITGSTIKTTDKDVFVLKVDNMGNNGFTATYNYDNFDDGGIFIDYVSSSSIEVAAITQDDAGGYQLSKLIYNSTGTLLNSYRTNIGYGNMRINDLKAVGGEYMVCGAVENSNGDWDFAVYSLSSSMTTNWSYIHDENGHDDEANALVVDGSGNVYATGYVNQNNDEPQLATAKLNSSGTQQWLAAYDYPLHFDSWGKAIDLSGSDLLITGEIVQDDGQTDIITLFTSATDGELNWRKEYDHNNNDIAINAFIIDDLEFVITGNSKEDENFVVGYELFWEDTSIVLDTTNGSHMAGQLIMRFNRSELKDAFLYNRNLVFGNISDVLNSGAINSLDTLMPDSIDLDSITISKIYTNLTPDDTISISRYGDTIQVPKFYQSVLIHLKNPTNEVGVCSRMDSLDSMFIDPIQYVTLNHVFVQRCNLGSVSTDYSLLQPGLHPTTTHPDDNIGYEDARCIEVGKPFVKVGIYDGMIDVSNVDLNASMDGLDKVAQRTSYLRGSPTLVNDAHGTNVAGICGAISNNSEGVEGVAGGDMANDNFGVTLYSQIIFNDGDGTSATRIVNAVVEGAMDDPSNGGALALDIMNHSYGFDLLSDLTIEEAKDEGFEVAVDIVNAWRFAYWNGVINVCSKGYMDKKSYSYPDGLHDEWVMTVASTDGFLELQDGNSFGYNLDFLAPGYHDASYNCGVGQNTYTNFNSQTNEDIQGTSQAAPHVTGIAGLMLSYYNNPNNEADKRNLAPEDVEVIIEQSCHDITTGINYSNGWDKRSGYGLVKADKALQLIERPNFLIDHYHASTWSETLVDEQVAVKVKDYYFNDDVNENAKPLKKNVKYNMNIYKVEIQIIRDWPKGPYQPWGDYSIVNSNTFPNDFEEDGWWSLGSRSNLWYYDESKKEVYPYNEIHFSEDPHKEIINGEEKMQATIYGYIFYVHKNNSNNNRIDQWYPHSDEEAHRLAVSVYYTRGWDVGISKPDSLRLNIYPNPAQNVLNFESNAEIMNVKVYDMMGKMVIYADKPNNQLDITGLINGMYLIECTDFKGRVKRTKHEILR